MKPQMQTAEPIPQTRAELMLKDETAALLDFMRRVDAQAPDAYGQIETRLDYFKTVTQTVEPQLQGNREELGRLQDWVRQTTDEVFLQSNLIGRARRWPQGYPGDYLTLEAVYANNPPSGDLGGHLDRYFLSRTLAIAVRARMRKLAELLTARTAEEQAPANWLNIACGSARELLSVPGQAGRHIWCLDRDPDALAYAQKLLQSAPGAASQTVQFVAEDVFSLGSTAAIQARFGALTTIYSAGLFGYIKTEPLIALLNQLYAALVPGGMLIAPFKDRRRYETFDYHWLAKWDYFLQRTEQEFYDLLLLSGIPAEKLTVERDASGVILFFSARK